MNDVFTTYGATWWTSNTPPDNASSTGSCSLVSDIDDTQFRAPDNEALEFRVREAQFDCGLPDAPMVDMTRPWFPRLKWCDPGFVEPAATAERLAELCARPLDECRWPIVMLDGVHLGEHLLVVALGVTEDGTKVPLGVVAGSTENTEVCARLVADLVDRGLDASRGMLFVMSMAAKR